MVQVKICGLTNLAEALCAVDAGADFLGFVFYANSPRYVPPQTVKAIVSIIKTERPDVFCVGLFVDKPESTVLGVMDFCRLDLAQLHGDECPTVGTSLGQRAYHAIRPRSMAEALDSLSRHSARPFPPDLLVDTYVPHKPGGTGQVGDWALAAQIAAQRMIFLAGGLTPHNVGEAIRAVRPWGVDVSSGVEDSPGRKSPDAIRQFVLAAKQASDTDA